MFPNTALIALLVSGLAVVVEGKASLDGIYALAQRRVPAHAHAFSFSLADGEGDAFTISDVTTGIHVECTTVSACARGFYTYLTQYGEVDIWWTGSGLARLPLLLPKVGKPVKGEAIVPYRYHFNTVTFDYTAPFWDFEHWELQLDWLALRGVNLPLAWVGYEYVLIETFRSVGLTDADIASFLTGPAFQAWNRFGNIQGTWGGELPTTWVNDQFALQKNILSRMTELGMTPIMPSFTGFVPRALSTLYPNASIVNGSQWGGFPQSLTNVSFLEPFDPLFATMQKTFLTKQHATYGNISHIYTLDQYNENLPYSGDTSYLANITASTFASLRAADPDAVWLMQGWLFYAAKAFWTIERIEAYLGGVPGNDSMIILDLYSEAYPQWNLTSSYFGKQWIWCELHDFGGNMGMEGSLELVTQTPIEALNSPGSSMKGIGLTMEGQEGNEIMYDIVLDQAWSSTPLDVATYVDGWVARRYTVKPLPKDARDAWQLLASTVYNNTNPEIQATIKGVYELSPAITGLTDRLFQSTTVSYDTNATVLVALEKLVAASKQNPLLKTVPEFAYDVVDLTRQLLSNRFYDYYNDLLAAFNSSSASAISAAGKPMLELITDIDTVLATNENFLLSKWISDARSWAHGNDSEAYAAYLEYNARNQITLWGPDGEISDYASRAWAGLVGTYYKPRWETFLSYLENVTTTGAVYNATEVNAEMIALGSVWCNGTWGTGKGETWGVQGDTWDVVSDLLQKWA